jgi:ArsR family transcriptional regulator, arsenate/arsenite/antimonite-responsive transcriptional repressor
MNLCEAFKALGDDTRLRILSLLSQQELCVCQLCETLRISQPNASKHLNRLRYSGLIRCRKRSQWCFYRISEDFAQQFAGLYAFLTVQWQIEKPYAEDRTRLNYVLRTQHCCGIDRLRE